MTAVEASASSRRIEAIDALRGIALIGMFIFHATWDLGFFRLIPPEFPFSPGFTAFGHVIAATFLGLSGASLVLAHPDRRPNAAFWKRLGLLVAACALISGVTFWLFPQSFIFFGILHCIALGSLVALPYLRGPGIVATLAGGLVIVLPLLIESPVFNAPALQWVGLGTELPITNDWRPVFPWLGFVLLGLGIARFVRDSGLSLPGAGWRAQSRPARWLLWSGRHSLLVYLAHQPLFFALAWTLAQILNPLPAARPVAAEPFVGACVAQCTTTGGDAEICQNVCTCISQEIRRKAPVWQRLLQDNLSPADRVEIEGFTKQCLKGLQP